MKQLRKQLTYANVMSSIAVFLVLGGGAAFAANQLAKNSVGSKQLKRNAVTTAKIKNNAVTTGKIKNGAISGAKINLGSLGTVPKAAHASTADSATKAGSATTAGSAGSAENVGGISAAKLNYSAETGSGSATIYSRSGLTITASCSGAADVSMDATTSKENASIYTSVVDTDIDDNNSNEDAESGNFDTGDTFDLLAGNDGNPGLGNFEYDAPDGTTISGSFSVDEAGVGGDCKIHGVVLNG